MEKIASFYVNANELDSAIRVTNSCSVRNSNALSNNNADVLIHVSHVTSASSMNVHSLDFWENGVCQVSNTSLSI